MRGMTRTGRAMMGAVRSTLGPRGRNIVRRNIFSGVLGDDSTLTDTPVPDFAQIFTSIAHLSDQQKAIQSRLDEDAKNRKIALAIGAASALFAAVKLGIIAFHTSKASRSI